MSSVLKIEGSTTTIDLYFTRWCQFDVCQDSEVQWGLSKISYPWWGKKLILSELPNYFVLLKQYNIFSTKIYQNSLELQDIDSSNREIITVKDIYEGTNILALNPTLEHTQSSKKSAKPCLMTSEGPFVGIATIRRRVFHCTSWKWMVCLFSHLLWWGLRRITQ